MKKHIELFMASWQAILIGVVALAGLGALLLYKLTSLVGGFSAIEKATANQVAASGLGNLTGNLPGAVASVLNFVLPITMPSSLRLTAAIFGFLSVVGMYYVISNWFSRFMGLVGAVLLATASWFLHVSRYGSLDGVIFLCLPILIAVLIMAQKHRFSFGYNYLALLAAAATIYVPGLIIITVILTVLQRQLFFKRFKRFSLQQRIIAVVSVILLWAPALYSVWASPSQIMIKIFGINVTGITAASVSGHATTILQFIFTGGIMSPITTLGSLPQLDILSSVMFVLGLVAIFKHRGLLRAKLLAIILILYIGLVLVGGVTLNALLVPIYLIVIYGICYYLKLWLKTFPRNPIARTTGYVAISLAVSLVSLYHLTNYFVAWPRASTTQSSFQQSP